MKSAASYHKFDDNRVYIPHRNGCDAETLFVAHTRSTSKSKPQISPLFGYLDIFDASLCKLFANLP